jgi:hypothetical protein
MAGPNSTKKALTTSNGIATADDIENRWARVQAKHLLRQSEKVQVLRNQVLGIEIVGEQKRIGITLSEACREFLEETRQHHRPKTYSQYKTALEYFRQSCREKPLCGVERSDVMSFMGFLSDRGLARRAIWTKVQVVVSDFPANTNRVRFPRSCATRRQLLSPERAGLRGRGRD